MHSVISSSSTHPALRPREGRYFTEAQPNMYSRLVSVAAATAGLVITLATAMVLATTLIIVIATI